MSRAFTCDSCLSPIVPDKSGELRYGTVGTPRFVHLGCDSRGARNVSRVALPSVRSGLATVLLNFANARGSLEAALPIIEAAALAE